MFLVSLPEGFQELYEILIIIKDGLVTVFDYFVNLGKFLLFTFKTALSFIAHIPQYCSWIPAEAISICITIFILVIVFKIMSKGADS